MTDPIKLRPEGPFCSFETMIWNIAHERAVAGGEPEPGATRYAERIVAALRARLPAPSPEPEAQEAKAGALPVDIVFDRSPIAGSWVVEDAAGRRVAVGPGEKRSGGRWAYRLAPAPAERRVEIEWPEFDEGLPREDYARTGSPTAVARLAYNRAIAAVKAQLEGEGR